MTFVRLVLVGAAFSLAALCLAACASDPKSPARTARAPDALYPLKAEPQDDRIALALHAEGLSLAQADALKALAARRVDEDGGPVTVSLPQGGADPALAARTAAAAESVLALQGVPVRRTAYDTPDPKAPLLVSYTRLKAVVADCGRHWDELTHTRDNTVQSNFGCAETANMAAMIANPADIVRPRTQDTPDAERRLTVLGKYAAGKVTAADEDPAKSGAVSKAVGP